MSSDTLTSFSLTEDDLASAIFDSSNNSIAGGSDLLPPLGSFNPPIVGTNGPDVLSTQADGDVILGLGGDDELSSAFNRTALFGDNGDDTLTTNVIVPQGSQPTDGLALQFGGNGQDTLSSTLKIHGPVPPAAPGAQSVSATNFLDGGAGNDVIRAELGIDTVTTANVTLKNVVFGGQGNDHMDLIANGEVSLGTDTLSNIADGGSGNDRITALAQTGFIAFSGTATNELSGGDGNDFLDATAIGTSLRNPLVSNTLDGGRGDDVLHASNEVNSNVGFSTSVMNLFGGDGNDVLVAVSREPFPTSIPDDSSHLDGGNGNDSLSADTSTEGRVAKSHNLLDGGSGNDTLTANLAMHVIGGAPPTVQQPVFDASNVLDGGSGNDNLNASLSINNQSGQADQSLGENHLSGGSGNDQLTAFAQLTGTAPLHGTVPAIANYLDGGAGDDVLLATIATGTDGASFLDGGSGNDRLTVIGGSGNVLNGGQGRDTLVSGTGNDIMDGGPGADVLVFAPGNGHDTATFCSGQDKIDLTAFAANNIHDIGDLDIQAACDNSIISFDANDSITVLNTPHLTASDFLFA